VAGACTSVLRPAGVASDQCPIAWRVPQSTSAETTKAPPTAASFWSPDTRNLIGNTCPALAAFSAGAASSGGMKPRNSKGQSMLKATDATSLSLFQMSLAAR